MGIIRVQTPNEGIVRVQIKGDEPTEQEIQAIRNQFGAPQREAASFQDLVDKYKGDAPQTGAEAQNKLIQEEFDTTTGVRDFGLRAALSVAEKPEEEDAIMAKQGFTSDEFTRDRRGRLALTPTGAAKLGIETEKNILIDEEGFSGSDFTDLLGIVPELSGGIAGAVKGAAIGSGFAPGIGTLLGGAVGAFVGGASGSLVEEAGEAIAGVSKQDSGEILKDAAIEGSLAAGGELLFGVPILIFKGLAPSGKRFIRESSDEQLKFASEALQKDYIPTRTTLKVNPIAAKQEQLTESVGGVSPRLRLVHGAMVRDTAELRKIIDDAAVSGSEKEAGELFIDFAEKASGKYVNAKRKALKNINQTIERAAEDIAGSFSNGATVSDDLYNILADTVRTFDDEAGRQFATIREITDNALGQKNFIPTNDFTDIIDLINKRFPSRNLSNAEDAIAQNLLTDLQNLGKKTNFNAVYDIRKKLLDVSRYVGDDVTDRNVANLIDDSSNLTEIFNLAQNKADKVLGLTNLKTFAREAKNLTKADEVKIAAAAKELPDARRFFKEGMDTFERLSSTLSIPSVVAKVRRAARTGTAPTINPGLAMRLVKNNNVKPLNDLRKAMTSTPNAPGLANYNTVKEEIGKAWLRQTMKTTGFDTATPAVFKPNVLQRKLNDLGDDVGNELFGQQQFARIKSFAKQFDDVQVSKLNEDTISVALDNGMDQGIVNAMQSALDAANDLSRIRSADVVKKIRNKNLKPDEAADVVAAPGVKKFQLEEIMKYYEGDEGALKTIRGHFLENMLQDVGATTSAKEMKELAARIAKADKNQKLNVIFGNETGQTIRKFGKFVEFASKDTTDSSLVAGGITASFFNNIGKILRITLIGQFFTGKKAIDDIIKAGNALRGGGEEAKRKFTDTIRDVLRAGQGVTQLTQEGVEDTNQQLKALAQNTGVTQAVNRGIGQVTNPIRNVAPPVANTNIGNIDVTDPGVASVLGLNPSDAAIAGRQIRRSNLMRQTP